MSKTLPRMRSSNARQPNETLAFETRSFRMPKLRFSREVCRLGNPGNSKHAQTGLTISAASAAAIRRMSARSIGKLVIVLAHASSVRIQRRLQSCTWNTPGEPTAREAPSLGRPVTRAFVSGRLVPTETRHPHTTDPRVCHIRRNGQRYRRDNEEHSH